MSPDQRLNESARATVVFEIGLVVVAFIAGMAAMNFILTL